MVATVLCIGPRRDRQLAAVIDAIELLGHRAIGVDSRAPSLPLRWLPDAPAMVRDDGGQEVVPTAAYLRALPPKQPALAQLAAGQRPPLQAFTTGNVDGNGRRDLVTAVLADIAERGGCVFNSPRAGSLLEHKPTQLREAARHGLTIPDTVAVGDGAPPNADADERLQEWIHKPIRGGEVVQQGAGLDGRPRFVQSRIFGIDVRVVVVGHTIHSVVATETLATVDPRADPRWAAGDFAYEMHSPPPPDVTEALLALTRTLQLSHCGVDFKVHQGQWTFLEANGAPIWFEADARLGLCTADALARALVAEQPSLEPLG